MFELSEILTATKAKLIQKSNENLFNRLCIDSRTIEKGDIFFCLKGNNFDGHDFIDEAVNKGAQAVIISKDVKEISAFKKCGIPCKSVNLLKVSDTNVALGCLAKYYRKKYKIPMIAITGSTGKTTTKDITAEILTDQFTVLKNFGTHNNHIGVPLTLFKLNDKYNFCVLELGSNHFGEISYLGKIVQPQIAIITNIGASHLQFLKDLKGVFKEKGSIINYLRGPKILLLNKDDIYLRKIKLPQEFKIFYFGIEETSDFMGSNIFLKNNRVNFIFNKKHRFLLNSLGRFNVYNALAGIGCGLIFGVSIKKIKNVLDNFQFPLRRLNKLDCSKFCILDDTYNSNPLSLKEAIESLVNYKTKGRKILVMGDMLELGSRSIELHRQIGSLVARRPIDLFVTLGNLSKLSAQAARFESKDNQSIFSFDSKQDVIDFLKTKIKVGDTLLIKGSRLIKMEDITSSLLESV